MTKAVLSLTAISIREESKIAGAEQKGSGAADVPAEISVRVMNGVAGKDFNEMNPASCESERRNSPGGKELSFGNGPGINGSFERIDDSSNVYV